MVTRALRSASSLPTTASTRQWGWICPKIAATSSFLGEYVFVSRVKKAGRWVLFANANKSQAKCPNAIVILSKASRLTEYHSFSKDNFGKKGVARGLHATTAQHRQSCTKREVCPLPKDAIQENLRVFFLGYKSFARFGCRAVSCCLLDSFRETSGLSRFCHIPKHLLKSF